MRYHAFLSYSHADKKWADWLHRRLETYRVPRSLTKATRPDGAVVPSRIYPVFRDREELSSSASLSDSIKHALTESRALIVICSPNAARSKWVNEEVIQFKRLRGNSRIFTLIVGGTPNAGTSQSSAQDQECLVEALRYPSKTPEPSSTVEAYEPLAADARAGHDGRLNAFLKIVAGLLDVPFDELKRRDERRRRSQRQLGFAIVLTLLVIFAALAGIAFQQSRVAVQTLAKSYFDRATELILRGQHPEAGRYLARAIRLAPEEACFSQMAFGYLSQPPPRPPTKTFAPGPIFSVDVDKKKELLLVGDYRGGVQLIRLSDGVIIANYARTEKTATLSQVAMGPLGGVFVMQLGGSGYWAPGAEPSANPTFVLSGHAGRNAAFTDDEQFLVGDYSFGELIVNTGSIASTLTGKLFETNLRDGSIHPLHGPHQSDIVAVRAIPKTHRVLSVSDDPIAALWDLPGEQPTKKWNLPARCKCVQASHDGSCIAMGLENGQVLIYSAESGELLRELGYDRANENLIPTALCFAEDDRIVAVGFRQKQGRRGASRIWDAATGWAISPWFRTDERVGHVDLDSTETRLLVGTDEGSVEVTDVGTASSLVRFHPGIEINKVFFDSSDDVCVVSDRAFVEIYPSKSHPPGNILCPHDFGLAAVDVSPDGARCVVLSSDRRLHQIWDLKRLRPAHPPVSHENKVEKIWFTKNSQIVISVDDQYRLESWDIRGALLKRKDGAAWGGNLDEPNGEAYFSFPAKDGVLANPSSDREFVWLSQGRFDVKKALALNIVQNPQSGSISDSRSKISKLLENRIVKLRAEDLSVEEILLPEHLLLSPKENSHGNTLLGTDAKDGFSLEVIQKDRSNAWRISTSIPAPTDGNQAAIAGFALSASGNSLLVFTTAGLYFTRLDRTELTWQRVLPAEHIASFSFSPDEKSFVVEFAPNSFSGSVQVFDSLTLRPTTPELFHADSINSVEFSPDGRFLLTASDDRTARLWSVSLGRLAEPPFQLEDRVMQATFTPDGKNIITVDQAGTLSIWPVPTIARTPPDWVARVLEQISGAKIDEHGNDQPTPVDGWTGIKIEASRRESNGDQWEDLGHAIFSLGSFEPIVGFQESRKDEWSRRIQMLASLGKKEKISPYLLEIGREEIRRSKNDLIKTYSELVHAAPTFEGSETSIDYSHIAAGTQKITSTGVPIRWCPPSIFLQGLSAPSKQRQEAIHLVLLSTGFWIGEHEITQEEWERITGQRFLAQVEDALGSQQEFLSAKDRKPIVLRVRDGLGIPPEASASDVLSAFLGPKKPAFFVNWRDATEFCRKLTALEKQSGAIPSGWEFRLPTAAEWEFASNSKQGAADSLRTPTIDSQSIDELTKRAWYLGNSMLITPSEALSKAALDLLRKLGNGAIHEVAEKEANALGIYDMLGNVEEWCLDDYSAPASGPWFYDWAIDPCADLRNEDASKITKGGSFLHRPELLAPASCGSIAPGYYYYNIGFRVVLAPRMPKAGRGR